MDIKAELERIRRAHGGILRPADVVRAARPVNSPLHSRFDWDDTTAAHQWRLEQARHLIRVCIQMVNVGGRQIESNVWVALTADKPDGGYRVLTDVLKDAGLRDALLRNAFEDMQRFRQKYGKLKELAEVFAAMKRVHGRRGVVGLGKVR